MTYTTAEVAKLVKVSKNTILNWCNGEPPLLLPDRDNRDWRVFNEDDLEMAFSLAENIDRR